MRQEGKNKKGQSFFCRQTFSSEWIPLSTRLVKGYILSVPGSKFRQVFFFLRFVEDFESGTWLNCANIRPW